MRRTRSRQARRSVVSGQTTPNRNGLVTDLDTSPSLDRSACRFGAPITMICSAQDVLVIQQDAAVVIEDENVVAAPRDGLVSDGDHRPCQPDESGCQKDGIAVCRLEC